MVNIQLFTRCQKHPTGGCTLGFLSAPSQQRHNRTHLFQLCIILLKLLLCHGVHSSPKEFEWTTSRNDISQETHFDFNPIGSIWDWYIRLHENNKNQPSVVKYSIHGSYRNGLFLKNCDWFPFPFQFFEKKNCRIGVPFLWLVSSWNKLHPRKLTWRWKKIHIFNRTYIFK